MTRKLSDWATRHTSRELRTCNECLWYQAVFTVRCQSSYVRSSRVFTPVYCTVCPPSPRSVSAPRILKAYIQPLLNSFPNTAIAEHPPTEHLDYLPRYERTNDSARQKRRHCIASCRIGRLIQNGGGATPAGRKNRAIYFQFGTLFFLKTKKKDEPLSLTRPMIDRSVFGAAHDKLAADARSVYRA
ncbi:hypothetical protein EVAR_62035_1 [Eumeta japonica]|uniref:Uncharacterized protein n=1 Tax=Eumeta variegata TaxID=151549 RepID=A0A4C1YRB6_EUMVA|nr:hypothetical protein EVAR_62035_1 [Eumeta japonica]